MPTSSMMSLQFGPPVPLDEITLPVALQHPVWVWAWEAGAEDEASDETDQCPVLNTTDVTDAFTEAIILFKVKGTDVYGSASFIPQKDRLEAIAFWEDGNWVMGPEASVAVPCTLVAIPTIRGERDVEFAFSDASGDEAQRVASDR